MKKVSAADSDSLFHPGLAVTWTRCYDDEVISTGGSGRSGRIREMVMPAKATRRGGKQANDVSDMALSIFDKVREIKRGNPAIARNIDSQEGEIRLRLEEIRKQIGKLDQHDRDLVTILVINGLHRTADEVLIER